MENRINHIITLDNGKKYFILKQAIYKGDNFFVAAEVTDDEQNLTNNFLILHETKEDGKSIVRVEQDKEVLAIILKHLDLKED